MGAFTTLPRPGTRPRPIATTARAALDVCPLRVGLHPIMDRIVLAYELAGLRAAEVTLALKVIDVGGAVTPYEPIAGARGRIMAHGLGESW